MRLSPYRVTVSHLSSHFLCRAKEAKIPLQGAAAVIVLVERCRIARSVDAAMAARVATLFLTLIAVAKGELIEELTISNGPTEMSAELKAEVAMEMDNVPDSTAMVEEITDAGLMNETSTTL